MALTAWANNNVTPVLHNGSFSSPDTGFSRSGLLFIPHYVSIHDHPMTYHEAHQWLTENVSATAVLDIPAELIAALDFAKAVALAQEFGAHQLVTLPANEREFFTWLSENDPDVWHDLWGGVDEDPYVVSLAFLPYFIDPSRGFPICDLETTPNYFFAEPMLHTAESKDFVEAVRQRFIAKQPLTVEQLLALEVSVAPIDIWHFAWHHGLTLADSKRAVQRLHDDNILLHIPSATDLANYIEV